MCDCDERKYETCDWRCGILSSGNVRQVGDHLWCTLEENLFSSEAPCELWQEQEYPVPRGEWRGPNWWY